MGRVIWCYGPHPIRVIRSDGNITLVAAGKTCYSRASVVETIGNHDVGDDRWGELNGVHRAISQFSGPGVDIDPLGRELGAISNHAERKATDVIEETLDVIVLNLEMVVRPFFELVTKDLLLRDRELDLTACDSYVRVDLNTFAFPHLSAKERPRKLVQTGGVAEK